MADRKTYRKRKKKLWLIPVLVTAAALWAGLAMAYRGFRDKEKAEMTARSHEAGPPAGTAGVEAPEFIGTVSWNGKKYIYNEHLSNFLFLGVDKEEFADVPVGSAEAGQSDSIFLLSWDRVTGAVTVILIPRDTTAAIEEFYTDGTSAGLVPSYMCLAYAYGDGRHKSCQLSAAAVSNLLYGVPIQGYCALSLNALPVMIGELGGLEVVVPNDSLTAKYPEYKEGTTITLSAENIEPYLRYRDTSVSGSPFLRLRRQEAFLKAYAGRVEEDFGKDPGVVTRVYTALDPCMVTNIGTDQFVRLMEMMTEGSAPVFWTLPGESVAGEVYDEYHADEEALRERIMETFYVEAE